MPSVEKAILNPNTSLSVGDALMVAVCGLLVVFLMLAILAKLDVSRSQVDKDLSALSAGQKKKLLLARSICEPAHLHVWDEPMNYIDVISRMQLEELLTTFQPTILFVEHDKAFCQNVATGMIEL